MPSSGSFLLIRLRHRALFCDEETGGGGGKASTIFFFPQALRLRNVVVVFVVFFFLVATIGLSGVGSKLRFIITRQAPLLFSGARKKNCHISQRGAGRLCADWLCALNLLGGTRSAARTRRDRRQLPGTCVITCKEIFGGFFFISSERDT